MDFNEGSMHNLVHLALTAEFIELRGRKGK